jgi:hypothetical protein
MAFRRFDHIDEMLDVARNCSNDLKLAKLRIAVLRWLIAHDGPVTMGEYPGDDGQADGPQEADRGFAALRSPPMRLDRFAPTAASI